MKFFYSAVIASAVCVTAANANLDGDMVEKVGKFKQNFMENMTEEQKSCFTEKSANCPKIEKQIKEADASGEKKFDKKDITPEMKEAMECKKQAMTECGIEMPARPMPQAAPESESAEPPTEVVE